MPMIFSAVLKIILKHPFYFMDYKKILDLTFQKYKKNVVKTFSYGTTGFRTK